MENIGFVVGVIGALAGVGALVVAVWRRARLAQMTNESTLPGSQRASLSVSTHRSSARTQPTHEQDPRTGFYVIGVFDLLGQSRKLREPVDFPATTAVEAERLDRNLRETVHAVDRFRQLFQRQFNLRRRGFEQGASEVPEPQRTLFREALASRIVSWGMSDTFCAAVPLEQGSGAIGAMATFADVRRLLEVAALTWLASLAEGVPFRGGIEIGCGAQMRENDVYGQALIEAHYLESKVAQWPRIVVGEELVGALHGAQQDPDVALRGAALYATQCYSMLRRDAAGITEIDLLGDAWLTAERRQVLSDVLTRAHNNVRDQLREHQERGATKLIARYEILLAYFNERAEAWR